MKRMNLVVALSQLLLVAGCVTGEKSVRPSAADGVRETGVTALVAEHPERLRDVVLGLIGEGPESDAALEIIGRYESDLRFVLDQESGSATIGDSAVISDLNVVDPTLRTNWWDTPAPRRRRDTSPSVRDRIRRFVRNSLSVAVIGLNECYDNFVGTKNVTFARKGLAHGYIALVSDPSPSQKSLVVRKMKVLQEPLMK